MHSTYNSEVLSRVRKYREQSYYNTPTNNGGGNEILSSNKPAGTIMMSTPTHLDGTVTHEQRQSHESDDANTTDEEKDKYGSTLVRELDQLDQKKISSSQERI